MFTLVLQFIILNAISGDHQIGKRQCKFCREHFHEEQIIIHYIIAHPIKSIPSTFGKVLDCPYCDEKCAYQNLSRHCYRKHLSRITLDKEHLPQDEPLSFRPRRTNIEDTNKKLSDCIKTENLTSREAMAQRKAEERRNESIIERQERLDADRIGHQMKRNYFDDETKKQEEKLKNKLRIAQARQSESVESRFKHSEEVRDRFRSKLSQETAEQRQERLKTRAEDVARCREKFSEEKNSLILRQRRRQYRVDRGWSEEKIENHERLFEPTDQYGNPWNSDDEANEHSNSDDEPDARVSEKSSYESLLKFYFKLGSGSSRIYAIDLMHNDLQLAISYGGKWEGIKVFYTSLQVGSYKIRNNEPISITKSAIILRAPCATYSRNMRTLFLMQECLEKIIVYFDSEQPMLFIKPNYVTCEMICKDLQMNHKSKRILLDSTSIDHTKKFITICLSKAPETLMEVLWNYYGSLTCEIGAKEAKELFDKCSQTNEQAKFQKGLDKCKNFDDSDSDFGSKISFQVPLIEPYLKFKLGERSKTIPELHKICQSCILDEGQSARFTNINIGTFEFSNDYLSKIEWNNPSGRVFLRPDVIYFNAPHLMNHSRRFTILILPEEVLKVETYTENITNPPWMEDPPRHLEGDRIHVFLTLKTQACARLREDLNLNAKSRGVFFDAMSTENVGYHKISLYFEQRFQISRQSIKFVEDFFQSQFKNVMEILDKSKGRQNVNSKHQFGTYDEIKELKYFNLGSGSSKEPQIQSMLQNIIHKPFQYESVESFAIESHVTKLATRLSFNDETIYFSVPPNLDKPKEKILIVIPYKEVTKIQAYEDKNTGCLFLTLTTLTFSRICDDLKIKCNNSNPLPETSLILTIRSNSRFPSLKRMRELLSTNGERVVTDLSFEGYKSMEDMLSQAIKERRTDQRGECTRSNNQ